MTINRSLALLAVASLALAACGGDDAESPDGQDTPAGDVAASTDPAASDDQVADGPVSTLSPDIPEQFLPGIGPVDVDGAPLPLMEDPAADPAIGMSAPALTGLDLDREAIRIDPAENGPAMVVFVAHWCPHCNEELPRINQLGADGRIPDGLDVIAVSTAASPDRPNWPPDEWPTDAMDWRYPAMLDGIDLDNQNFFAAAAYGVNAFPFTVLVDGNGTVVDRWSGERAEDEIAAAIDAGLGLG